MNLPRDSVRTLSRPKSWSNQVWEIYERVTGKPRPAMFESTRELAIPRNDAPPL